MASRLHAAVIGAGHQGANLARSLRASREWDLLAICDSDVDRARRVADGIGGAPVVPDLDAVLADPGIDAVVVATLDGARHRTVRTALDAGKHVLVDTQLADTRERGHELVRGATQAGLVLMADDAACYTPAVLAMRELIADGSLGDILVVDGARFDRGPVAPDVDVLRDLAPPDLSILDFALPGGLAVTTVTAHESDPLATGRSPLGHLALSLESGAMVHLRVNRLSPIKVRRMIVGGTRRTLVWDRLDPQRRVSVYDRGADLDALRTAPAAPMRTADAVYRFGDAGAPAREEREALGRVVGEFAASIRERRAARTGGAAALRVLAVLDAAAASLAAYGAPRPVVGRRASAVGDEAA